MAEAVKLRSTFRGRGAKSNASGRFEATQVEAFDDGWTADDATTSIQIATTITPLRSRTIISKNQSPDIGFERSINPYIGCAHGCSYCYARPSHAYLGLSPGLDFESRIFSKPDAARLLEQELSAKKYVCKRIHIGGNTDPYQPHERELKITRGVLEVMQRFNHPCSVITKSNLITRDLDILGPMGREKLATAFVSITTLDRSLARAMEPRASISGDHEHRERGQELTGLARQRCSGHAGHHVISYEHVRRKSLTQMLQCAGCGSRFHDIEAEIAQAFGDGHTHKLFIIDQQNGPASVIYPGRICNGLGFGIVGRDRQNEFGGRALPNYAGEREPASGLRGQAIDHREPKAGPQADVLGCEERFSCTSECRLVHPRARKHRHVRHGAGQRR